ncbi:MAG: hypothetical protein EOO61_17085 [Hymenobacter sp.]|nr:MAG: hypothetical protein EOO61_17085 [Hymenobacter sp.]
MRRIVNIYYVSRLFDPLFSLSDEEIDSLSAINFNDEAEAKGFFQQRILENFERYGPKSKIMCRNALQYVLCTSASPYSFPDLFPYGELPVEAPDDTKLFFSWLWQILFSNERIPKCDEDEFIINNDYNAPNSAYIK